MSPEDMRVLQKIAQTCAGNTKALQAGLEAIRQAMQEYSKHIAGQMIALHTRIQILENELGTSKTSNNGKE